MFWFSAARENTPILDACLLGRLTVGRLVVFFKTTQTTQVLETSSSNHQTRAGRKIKGTSTPLAIEFTSSTSMWELHFLFKHLETNSHEYLWAPWDLPGLNVWMTKENWDISLKQVDHMLLDQMNTGDGWDVTACRWLQNNEELRPGAGQAVNKLLCKCDVNNSVITQRLHAIQYGLHSFHHQNPPIVCHIFAYMEHLGFEPELE